MGQDSNISELIGTEIFQPPGTQRTQSFDRRVKLNGENLAALPTLAGIPASDAQSAELGRTGQTAVIKDTGASAFAMRSLFVFCFRIGKLEPAEA